MLKFTTPSTSQASPESESSPCKGQQQYLCEQRNYLKKAGANMKSLHTLDICSTPGDYSPILTCIRSIQGSEALWGSEKLNLFKRLSFKELKREQNLKYEDGFCFAVSLQDGSTLYISSAVTKHLGYPKDMLVGQCIMNFLYQKDHITFANHLTQGLNACFTQGHKDESHLVPNSFFCRLRAYHSLKYGYGISQKKAEYKPFKVTLHINDLIFDDVCVEKGNSTLCVKATATPLSSAYQVSEEIPAMTSFSTRHTASCHFSHVDASAIPYLGYLPQDMIGYSIFDFYHIDDMPRLKDIYELVVKEQGSSFRSKPYRFKVFNGCYITLETEWSCFINPWSRKLEFVVGQHRVLKGPTDINVLSPCNLEENSIPEEDTKECFEIQKEIKNMLSQPIKECSIGKTRRFSNKRKRDLASFVCNFIDENGSWNKNECSDKHCADECSNSDPESVVMGDISPHQESSTFSEIPPTCQEIRYQQNIERFFASQQKRFSDGSEEGKSDEKLSNSDESGGNASKQQESLPSNSGSGGGYNNKQQEYGSTSSRGNFSFLTNADSGYKSIDKDQPVSTGEAPKSQLWGKNSSVSDVKCPPYSALTEESLCEHNRLNNKYIKHRKGKTHVNTPHMESGWLKHNESGHSNATSCVHKPKKYARIRESATPTALAQVDDAKVPSMQEQPAFSVNPPFSSGAYGLPMSPFGNMTFPSAPASPAFPTFGVTPYPYVSPSCASGVTPPAMCIPMMYMGGVPYFPPMSNLIPPNAVPVWPCAPVTPNSVAHASPISFPSPILSNSCPMPVPFVPVHTPQPAVNPGIGNMFGVQPSGATATTTVLTTTTTVAPGIRMTAQNPGKVDDSTRHGRWASSKLCSGYPTALSSSSSHTGNPCEDNEDHQDMDLSDKLTVKGDIAVRQDPPWLVDLTPDVIFRYQMELPKMEDILRKDMVALRSMVQPDLVNQQLKMLHAEHKEEAIASCSEDIDVHVGKSYILGLTTDDDKQELGNEKNLFQLMAEDV